MADIILAEDDSSMREFIKRALEKAGHTVRAEEDGLSALSAFEKDHRYDLLLTDIVMPGMDGVELARQATKIQKDLQVMFITGFAAVAMNEYKDTHSDNNGPNVLSKPFHLNDLVIQVEKLLEAA